MVSKPYVGMLGFSRMPLMGRGGCISFLSLVGTDFEIVPLKVFFECFRGRLACAEYLRTQKCLRSTSAL